MNARIGICAWSLPAGGLFGPELARQLGFDALQLELSSTDHCQPYAQPRFRQLVLDACRRENVTLLPLTLNALCGHGFVNGLDETACHIIDTGVETAAALGVEGIAVPSFGVNEIRRRAHLDATVEGLRYACQKAQAHGLTVYTENVLSVQPLEDVFVRCGCENLRLLFDSQNYGVMGNDDALEVLHAFRDRLGCYVHVKDGDRCMGELPLGEGRSPIREVMAFLRETDYQGTIVIENNYDAPPLCPAEGDAFAAIVRDVQTLRTMMND